MTKHDSRQFSATVCFCTLAIHAPYRRRAKILCTDVPWASWIILTDEPDDFAGLPVRAIRHEPTGPMAVDYLSGRATTGEGKAAAAYHDKRFVLMTALRDFETAIYVDADSRIKDLSRLGPIPAGLNVLPVRESIAEHLEKFGAWRRPAFVELARHLTGDDAILRTAPWCTESFVAITRDGRESRFFESWGVAAQFMQSREVHSGEGGVIGLAAACAGWQVNYDALAQVAARVLHEAGGPKRD